MFSVIVLRPGRVVLLVGCQVLVVAVAVEVGEALFTTDVCDTVEQF